MVTNRDQDFGLSDHEAGEIKSIWYSSVCLGTRMSLYAAKVIIWSRMGCKSDLWGANLHADIASSDESSTSGTRLAPVAVVPHVCCVPHYPFGSGLHPKSDFCTNENPTGTGQHE